MDLITTLILNSSIINGVDYKLLTAICMKESNLRNVTVMDNGSYSYGPCQVKKVAAKHVGMSKSDITKLENNINVAALYLKEKINVCKDILKAIGAYNTGRCIIPKGTYVQDVVDNYVKLQGEIE